MNDELRHQAIEKLKRGDELPTEWQDALFPIQKKECELAYRGKERVEDVLAETMGVPLQLARSFGKNGHGWHNRLIFGDNLQVMKTLLQMKERGDLVNADGSPGVRLVYIDPPFATKRDFRGSQDQRAYQDRVAGAQFLEFLRKRLILIRQLLSDDGYIFVHLDQKKSHYVKVLMDEVFGEHNFLNHVIWSYRRWPSQSRNFQAMHDDILMYAAKASSSERPFNLQYEAPSDSYVKRFQGKTQILDEMTGTRKITVDEPTKGMPLRDVWDLSIIAGFKGERTAYPTQKPESLVARILEVCSRPGDLVLDAFAGSGTTCAVAEKLGRRWVAIDCGKLAIYTVQKRMLSLRKNIGHYGPELAAKSFSLYNAGLYDFSKLKELPWEAWRFFALELFGCKDDAHTIGGIKLDGKLKGASVLVFNHHANPGKRIDEETVQDIHAALGKRVGTKFFIIAPRGVFDFQQDYIDLNAVRYYALRIPYSVINELHQRQFKALTQPNDERAVNDIVDAWGFDFIQPPAIGYEVGVKRGKNESEAFLKLKKFESRARLRGEEVRGGLESFSMLMLDLDYDGNVFELDQFWFAHQMEEAKWECSFSSQKVGAQVMAVFIDLHGNEAREVIPRSRFGLKGKIGSRRAKVRA